MFNKLRTHAYDIVHNQDGISIDSASWDYDVEARIIIDTYKTFRSFLVK